MLKKMNKFIGMTLLTLVGGLFFMYSPALTYAQYYGYNNSLNNIQNYNLSSPSVTTNTATSIGSKSVKLNSLIINYADNNSTTWFEWGTSPTLGNMTTIMPLGTLASAKHINTLTGLAPGTTYYFRAVLSNSSYRTNGVTLSFTTANAPIVSNAAEETSPTEKDTNENTAITNTSTIEPAAEPTTAEGANLGASVIGSSASFFPSSLLGWLFLIILILTLILISKHLYRIFLGGKVAQTPEEHL